MDEHRPDEYKPHHDAQSQLGKAIDRQQTANMDDYPEFYYG